MKKFIIVMMILVLCISMTAVFCACDKEKIYNLDDVAGFDNGVLFDITSVNISQSIEGIRHPIVTENKFIIIKMKVINNSKETYSVDADIVWIDYNGTKIGQTDDMYLIDNYFDLVSLPATLSKEYVLLFEVNKDISLDDVVLRISNNYFWHEKTIGIRLV